MIRIIGQNTLNELYQLFSECLKKFKNFFESYMESHLCVGIGGKLFNISRTKYRHFDHVDINRQFIYMSLFK